MERRDAAEGSRVAGLPVALARGARRGAVGPASFPVARPRRFRRVPRRPSARAVVQIPPGQCYCADNMRNEHGGRIRMSEARHGEPEDPAPLSCPRKRASRSQGRRPAAVVWTPAIAVRHAHIFDRAGASAGSSPTSVAGGVLAASLPSYAGLTRVSRTGRRKANRRCRHLGARIKSGRDGDGPMCACRSAFSGGAERSVNRKAERFSEARVSQTTASLLVKRSSAVPSPSRSKARSSNENRGELSRKEEA